VMTGIPPFFRAFAAPTSVEDRLRRRRGALPACSASAPGAPRGALRARLGGAPRRPACRHRPRRRAAARIRRNAALVPRAARWRCASGRCRTPTRPCARASRSEASSASSSPSCSRRSSRRGGCRRCWPRRTGARKRDRRAHGGARRRLAPATPPAGWDNAAVPDDCRRDRPSSFTSRCRRRSSC
jgi:hypothetical protein